MTWVPWYNFFPPKLWYSGFCDYPYKYFLPLFWAMLHLLFWNKNMNYQKKKEYELPKKKRIWITIDSWTICVWTAWMNMYVGFFLVKTAQYWNVFSFPYNFLSKCFPFPSLLYCKNTFDIQNTCQYCLCYQ